MSLRIDTSDEASPALERMHATLADRQGINENIGESVASLCKFYVQQDAPSRHESAQRVGGEPTGFLGGAVEGIHSESDADGATIDFSHAWFARGGHDVTITPGTQTPGVKYLAIAIDSEAYGHRAMIGVDTPRFPGSFVFKSKKGNLIIALRVGKGKDAKLRPLYYLAPEITQAQDRSRLPSDEAIEKTAIDMLKTQLHQRLRALESAAHE